MDPDLAAEAQEIGAFRNVVNTAPANPITTNDPLRLADGLPEPNVLALSSNAVDPAAPIDFDPTHPVGSDSFFVRLAARMSSVAGSISRSLSSAALVSQGSQPDEGMRLPTELLLSNLNPDGDVGLGGDQINASQPGVVTTGSALTGTMSRLSLSGSGRTSPSIVSYIGSSLSGPFDPNNPPEGIPLGSRFIEAYPLVYTINGIAPPPPGFVPGRMSPDPLPLRKY